MRSFFSNNANLLFPGSLNTKNLHRYYLIIFLASSAIFSWPFNSWKIMFTFISLLDMGTEYGIWSNWSICISENKTCQSLGSMTRTRSCYNSTDNSIVSNKYCGENDAMMDSCQTPCLHYGKTARIFLLADIADQSCFQLI